MMTEQEFDSLWQRAEAEPHATRLKAEYPAWRRNRRNSLGVAAMLVAVVAVALPLMTNQVPSMTRDGLSATYSNRPDLARQYWVDLADALLMEA